MNRTAYLEMVERAMAELSRLREQLAADATEDGEPGPKSAGDAAWAAAQPQAADAPVAGGAPAMRPPADAGANAELVVPGAQRTSGGTARRRLVARLVAHWAAYKPPSVFESGDVAFDLATPEGRSRLLVFAVLSAAKLREGVAERAFLALEAAGLLSPDRLRQAEPSDQGLALNILQSEYKALISKAAKVNAIYANQRLLDEVWGGDLSDIYLTFCGDDAALISALQQFAQMKSRAYWLCRELKAHGIWTEVGPEASLFVDVDVRRAMHNLGLVRPDASSYEATREACEEVIRNDFGGDVLPLYRHGRQLCAGASFERCLSKCPVMSACSVWAAAIA